MKLHVLFDDTLTASDALRDLMGVQFTATDMEAQMRVKDVFDPKWLLNPAKVFPLDVSASRRAG